MGRDAHGFTLVEILMTLAVSSVVVSGIYSAHILSQKSCNRQEEILEIQQNLRVALEIVIRDIRMAGYDPEQTGNYGIVSSGTNANQLAFTADFCENGGIAKNCRGGQEIYNYALYDADKDGKNDSLRKRKRSGAIAENIEAVEFYYLLDNEEKVLEPNSEQLAQIKAITISMLAKGHRRDAKFINKQIYTPASGSENSWGAFNDNYHRRMMISTVYLRN